MRKIAVMLLALIIALGMTATVFAAEDGTEQDATEQVLDMDDEEIVEADDEELSEIEAIEEEEESEPEDIENEDLLPALAPAGASGTNPDTGTSPLYGVSIAAGIISLAALVTLSYKRQK